MSKRRRPFLRVTGQVILVLLCLGADWGSAAQAVTQAADPEVPDTQAADPEVPEPPLPPKRQPILGLIIGGASAAAVTWGLAVLPAGICDLWNHHFSGSTTDASGVPKCDTWPLYIPLIGPWLSMAMFHLHGGGGPFGDSLLALDGILQAAGVAILIGGAVGRIPNAPFAINDLRVAPMTLRSGSGVLVSGRF